MQVAAAHALALDDVISAGVQDTPLLRVYSELAQEMRHVHCRPLDRLFERNLFQNDQVAAIPQEDRVLLYLDVQHKVSGDVVPADSLFAEASGHHRLAVFDPARHVECDGLTLGRVTLEAALATAARLASRAVAGRAWLRDDKHLNHALTAAHLAVLLAVRARPLDGHTELLGAAVEGVQQGQRHSVVRVLALDLLLGHAWEPTREPAWEALGRGFWRPKLVKVSAFIRVGQNLVGRLDLFKLLGVAGPPVWMVHDGELLIRFFNIF